MEIEILIKSIMGLIAILAGLFFILFSSLAKKKKIIKEVAQKQEKEAAMTGTNLNYLRSVIKNKETSTKKLQQTLNLILRHHGQITKEGEKKALSHFDIYMEIIFRLCRHPNVTKELIINFCLELEKKNPMYVKNINQIMFKGLDSRVS